MTDAFNLRGTKSDSTTASKDNAKRAQDDMLVQAQIVREDLRELGHLGKEAAKELVGEAKQTAQATYRQGKKQVSAAGDRIVGYVEQNPLKSVLVAAAAGALIGVIWSRRR